jgi:hypothetical protein
VERLPGVLPAFGNGFCGCLRIRGEHPVEAGGVRVDRELGRRVSLVFLEAGGEALEEPRAGEFGLAARD